jgi:hypothetical protein
MNPSVERPFPTYGQAGWRMTLSVQDVCITASATILRCFALCAILTSQRLLSLPYKCGLIWTNFADFDFGARHCRRWNSNVPNSMVSHVASGREVLARIAPIQRATYAHLRVPGLRSFGKLGGRQFLPCDQCPRGPGEHVDGLPGAGRRRAGPFFGRSRRVGRW